LITSSDADEQLEINEINEEKINQRHNAIEINTLQKRRRAQNKTEA